MDDREHRAFTRGLAQGLLQYLEGRNFATEDTNLEVSQSFWDDVDDGGHIVSRVQKDRLIVQVRFRCTMTSDELRAMREVYVAAMESSKKEEYHGGI